MKLLINGKYEKVGFWSLMKCLVLVELTLTVIIYALALIIGLSLGY